MSDDSRVLPVDFCLSDRLLNDEERVVRARVRAFAETHLRPVARTAWEAAEFQAQLLPELAKVGIVGGMVEGHDCPTLSPVGFGLAMQELSRVDSSFGTFFGIDGGLVMAAIATYGSEEQKARWLPPLRKCEAIGAFALTEPEYGSDASRLATRARRDGGEYVLDGAKRWIGMGSICDVAIIWARAEDGIAGFLVERSTPGYVATKIEGKLSQRSIWQTDITLSSCRVPAANRLPVGEFGAVADLLHRTRHNIAWHALGEAIACYEIARDYALRREQFGRPIAGFQLVQAKLVRMLGEITKTQLLVIQLGRLLEQGKATPGMTAYAKLSATAMAREVAATAREIIGGNGILQEFEVMRHLCDVEGVYTYEGTYEINTLVVGREITGLRAFA
ncbi:MAG TPA: acyl-CoA dehydrogenase family protein [Thermomicrobiales bacterium]|nr:acyl-CoA dehydrogenase family protein [Thermomicrobiales bacterium]